jgi:hypothetical protein
LTPASRRQDHTTSPSASAPFVNQSCRVHRIPPRVRDDRDTPLMWGRTARDIEVIWVRRERKYFCNQGWTGQITLIRFDKSAVSRISTIGQARAFSSVDPLARNDGFKRLIS